MLCKIGEVEVWRILEIHAPFMPPEDLFPTAGSDVSAVIESLAPGSIDAVSGRLILPIQGFLLKTPSHNILVDSCVGNHKTNPNDPDWHQRSDGRFMAALTAAGIGPAEVDYVLCTHLHIDHIGWNTQLEDGRWVPTFPNARYLMPADDEAVQRARHSHAYIESVLPVIEAGQAELVQAGHCLGDHVTLIPTPGHTPGHVSVLVKSGDRQAIITGDALHSSAQCWHPDWHFLYDVDAEMAVTSRRDLLEQCAESNCTVLGSHFALPSIGHVKAEKDAFRWEE
ncbi:metallo-beta-lactamase superfamily protein [Yoonia maricola]|uniref:Metallo-beta-lactamase superfamily protein n=1 Tax=Yoonia maricola TaxID=420999 RepID=A0A2M8W5F7_9RHOB|nr:MBL fold metallo-hydrolase [Yoonia maricola]PJI86167.1 metallo-beta-lactamase superfamily protein [Yoonia maricola]